MSNHAHAHAHAHADSHGHGHSHGLIDAELARSSDGVRVVAASLVVLLATALVQTIIYLSTGSVALLADLTHNAGDALTAIPLGAAFLLRSRRAERWAGGFVVLAIFASACVAGVESVLRLVHPEDLHHLGALAAAGLVGCAGNEVAARIRLRGGARLDSAALIADGRHARVDGLVSLGVVASAGAVAIGFPLGDPLIGLAITVIILRVTWQSIHTIRDAPSE
ncbi:MAG TPA: cation diffusion facilitator family transporter [Baekduia sp.]